MRFTVFAISTCFALPASAFIDDFSTREGCLKALAGALQSSADVAGAKGFQGERLATAPDSAGEHVEAAIAALERRAQATADYADALLLLCQSYE